MEKVNLNYLRNMVYLAANAAGFEVNLEEVRIEKTKQLEHGHFASNIAMFLAKKIGKAPRDVAQAIIEKINRDKISKVEIAGPGFINLSLEQFFYTTEIRFIIEDLDNYLKESIGFDPGKKTLVIDTSHPNIAKPMGVHHLLSTIIGYSIREIYRKAGYKVINDNYLGDYGTQFGKLIYAIKTWGNMDDIEVSPIDELQKLYVQFHEKAKKDESLDEQDRKSVV